MEGTVNLELSYYEALKRDSEDLKNLANNPDGYVRIYERDYYSCQSYILVRFRTGDNFAIEAHQLNQSLRDEIYSLKSELMLVKEKLNKKHWWQIWK